MSMLMAKRVSLSRPSDYLHSMGGHSAGEVSNPCLNVSTTKCIILYTCVSIFSQTFSKGVSTPLDHKCICNELEHLVAL